MIFGDEGGPTGSLKCIGRSRKEKEEGARDFPFELCPFVGKVRMGQSC